MYYVPYLYSLEGELSALNKQDFSNNIMPLVNIIKDKKTAKTTKSVFDDLENIVLNKPSNTFFVNIPMNLVLEKKKIKKPIEAFYKTIASDSNYQISILKRFEKLSNVIPVIDVNSVNYNLGDLKKIRSQLKSKKVAYIFYAKKSTPIFLELSNLITSNDILIYNLEDYSFYQKSIKEEIKKINTIKNNLSFSTIVIKQIYKDLTFFKFPNDKILPSTPGYDCIDSDFFDEFSSFKFDYFGDHCGIRNIPIYSGGNSYPSFIGLDKPSFSHYGFKGIEEDPNSHSTTLLPNIINSHYWNNILKSKHKTNCHGCLEIERFNHLHIPRGESNPINSATTWKKLVICHYISMMDYKLSKNLIT